ncbi:MAG: VWA domain-containing protein [Thermoanaerobaculaceae bacterium]|nr:VWA domain-containing protein [Thermoanaerobaculaceae bacterium]TAM44300.1 MAG: VWA domain-containing protein [Acidobacteriota bacterium]
MATANLGRVAVALAAVVGLAGRPAAAQDKAPVGAFSDTAQVNLINVDVFVADKAGKAVPGLRPEDFEVFEDGVRVVLTNFYASPALRAATAATAAEAATPSPQAGEPVLPPLEQRLSLVLLVDDTGITPAQRNVALRHAQALIDAALKLPHAEVMVVTYAQAARIRQRFTNDAAALAAALKAVAAEPTDSVGADLSNALIEGVMSRSTTAPRAAGGGGALMSDFDREDALSSLQAVRAAAEQAHERVRAMLAAMKSFVSTLAGLPGRKVICYVGNGIPQRPGETLLERWESRFGSSNIAPGFSAAIEANRLSVTPEFRDLVARANADRVTFYALDATGGGGSGGSLSAEQVNLDADLSVGKGEAMGRGYSLQYLAHATGGTTVVSTPQASPALARIVDDFGAFYSLAYAAPHIGDGKDHSISVKVKRDGVIVRHRRHYLDKTADDRMADRSLAALMYDSGSNGLDAGVAVGNDELQKSNVFLVPVMVTIPLARLALLPKNGGQEGSISIWLAAKDGDDRITLPTKRVFAVRIPEAELPGALRKSVSYVFKLLMTPGAQTVAVSVRDDLSQVESTVTARFTVGRGEKRGPGVLVGMTM